MHRCYEGDKFLLKVRLLEDRSESVMYSQAVRVIEKDDETRITRNIFTARRERRGRGL